MKKISKFTWLKCIVNSNFFKSKKDFRAPKKVNNYILVEEIKKKYLTNYSVGVYKKAGKKYFIKSWASDRIDYEYYSLINEFNVTTILHKHRSKTKNGIKFVKAVELIEEPYRISAVYEYVKGKNLTKTSQVFQSKVISMVMTYLPTLTDKISTTDMEYFKKRSLTWFVFTLPLRLVKINISAINKFKILIQTFRYYCSNINNTKLELAHRDLTPENIMVDIRGNIYLIDLEQVCMSFKGYDTQNYLISPQNQKSIQYLAGKAPMLNNYISTILAIHSLASESLPEFINYYSKFITII